MSCGFPSCTHCMVENMKDIEGDCKMNKEVVLFSDDRYVITFDGIVATLLRVADKASRVIADVGYVLDIANHGNEIGRDVYMASLFEQ